MRRAAAIYCILFFYSGITLNAQYGFVTRSGKKLLTGKSGAEVHLRGVCFGNRVWENAELPNSQTEEDYRRVREMGMNTIRFYMNYLTFEDDGKPYKYKASGWDWIDSNIVWAKKNHLYLILNIHVPQGGFQSQCKGTGLWKNPDNQKRLTALWYAIAKKYSKETTIAAFDLLNEPIPSDSVQQWYSLCQRLADTIRVADANHLIVVANAIAVNCDYTKYDRQHNFPRIQDPNVMYSAHFYEPFYYTHQMQAWAGTGEGGKYPDSTLLSPPSDLTWAIGQYNNPRLPPGNSDWTYSEGFPFKVTDDSTIAARPGFAANSIGKGQAYFDRITISEVDESGKQIRQIFTSDLGPDLIGWYWSQNKDGSFTSVTTTGSDDQTSVFMTGASGYASLSPGNERYLFKVEKGKSYRISGWMKGIDVPSNAIVYLSISLFHSPSHAQVHNRDAAFLKSQVMQASLVPDQWGYPVYFGEFGVVRNCFENGKGGDIWVRDMLQIFDSLNDHWSYHDYREAAFGIFEGTSGPVNTSTGNLKLINTFRRYFKKTQLKQLNQL